MDPRTRTRNIVLVREDNPEYHNYVEGVRLGKFQLNRLSGSRSYADILAVLLEKAVRAWVAPYGGRPERILTYEQLGRNKKYTKRYRELDFVIDHKDTCYVGELKVSSHGRKSISKAYMQLSESVDVLLRTGEQVVPMVIFINLLYEHTQMPMQDFDPDFGKVAFTRRTVNGRAYIFLHLNPVDIYHWAVEKEIIRDDTLLENALEEARKGREIRLARHELKAKGVPEAEWPADLQPNRADNAPVVVHRVTTGSGSGKGGPELAAILKEALSEPKENGIMFGSVQWFDNEKLVGNAVKTDGESVFLHIDNFSRRPRSNVRRNDIILIKRIIRSDMGDPHASGCRVLELPVDFIQLMVLLGHDAVDKCIETESMPTQSEKSMSVLDILRRGTRQIFYQKSPQIFVETVQRYYDRGLPDPLFVRFCWFVEHIALPEIKTDDQEMLLQTLYCHYYSNLRAGILFYVWKHDVFRYIAYTEGQDYEIPMEILLAHADELEENDMERIHHYSYASLFFTRLSDQRQ